MQSLPPLGQGKSPALEKILRVAFLLLIGFGLLKLWNHAAPTLIEALHNFWTAVFIGVPAICLILYVMKNPMFLWMGYLSVCRKITAFFVKYDPLGFMDSYIEVIKEKRAKLKEHKNVVAAQKISMERELKEVSKTMLDRLKMAQAAQQINDMDQANHLSGLAAEDKESLESYKPTYKRLDETTLFLDELDINWGRSIERLENQVDRKRKEYKTLYAAAKALGQAEEFIRGGTEEGKVFKMSIQALEEKSAAKIAYIEAFMKDSKDVMGRMRLEKQVLANDGMDLLQQYIQNKDKLLLTDITDEKHKTVLSAGKSSDDNEFSNLI